MYSEYHRIFAATVLDTMLSINYSKTELDLWFLIIILYLFSCFVCLFYVPSIFLCIVSPFVYSLLFLIIVQVYRTPPPGGNPIAVNKYHITSHHISILRHIILYHTSYHIISYHIIYHITSYHIVSYHISHHTISYHIISDHNIYHVASMEPGTLRS